MRLFVTWLLLGGCDLTGKLPAVDADGDGYAIGQDCDDGDGSVHPDAAERCNGVDDDCDGGVDTHPVDGVTSGRDADGDGFGDVSSATVACDVPAGWVADATDCDDGDAAVHPGADESDCADPTDYNCDGSVGAVDRDGDGSVACRDCDDGDAARHPGATEVCDGAVDEDCDGLVDDADTDVGGTSTWYQDADGDGWGNSAVVVTACAAEGYVAVGGDCDDTDPTVFPDGTGACGTGTGDDTADTDTPPDTSPPDTGAPDTSAHDTDTASPHDTGSPPDTGPPSDTGPPADTAPPADTGTSPTDTGTLDTGTSPVDTGTVDTGPSPVDTGASPVDTGTSPVDTGGSPGETGTPADTGTSPTETAAPPADTAPPARDTAGPPADTAAPDSGATAPPSTLPPDTAPADTAGDTAGDTAASRSGIHFLVVGDTGDGGAGQYAVAAGMEAVCALEPCDFVLLVGDNFYPAGVSSATDPQWQSAFELPYAGLDLQFWAVMGNHDWDQGDDPTYLDAEVDYTAVSSKWYMPADYYTRVAGDVTFYALDTQLIDLGEGAAQEAWLPGELASSTTTWNIGWGHHPYLSNGPHGNASGDLETFYDSYVCGQFDVFFAGHDHNLQWLEDSCGTEWIVSGAGHSTYPLGGADPTYFEAESTGFLWVEIDGNDFTGVFYDEDGVELYRQTFTK